MREFSLKNESILDGQIKEFTQTYKTSYTYDEIKKWEDFLNKKFQGSYERLLRVVDNFEEGIVSKIDEPMTEGFGNAMEKHVYNVLKDGRFYLGLKDFKNQNPNGAMEFPDYQFNGICLDSKVVKCFPQAKKNGYSIQYSSGLGEREDLTKHVKNFVDSNELDEKTSALIIITYYTEDPGEGIKILKVKIVPILFYIACYKDEHDLRIKQVSDGTEIKNSNVTGRLKIVPGSCEVYLNTLRRTIQNKFNY